MIAGIHISQEIFAIDVLTALTLPVRKYLVPTPSTKGGGGGVESTPYDLENGRFYKLQLWQAIIGLSMKGKKLVELMS